MRHIFISYNHDDGDFAEILSREVAKVGLDTWMDTDRLRAGEDWRAEIDQAIKEAAALIVVMTPKAKESEYITYEWAFALGAGVRVIPILLKPTELHPRLEALQYLDFSNRVARPWDALIEALQKAVEADAPHTVRVPRDVPLVIKQAVAALDSASPTERKAAIETLAQMDHPAAREMLAEAVQHPVRDVRILAAFGLAEFKDARAVPDLLEALHDQNLHIRKAAARALGQIGDPVTVPSLIDALHDEYWNVGEAAIEALGQIEDAVAVPGLLDALRDESSNERWYFTGSGIASVGDTYMREAVVEVLEQIWDAEVLDLLDAMHDENYHVREAAFKALVKVGDTAVPDLLNALRDENDDTREAAAEVLVEIGNSAAVPDLLNALRDKNSNVRGYVAKALGQIGDAIAVPGLIERLSDTEEPIAFYSLASMDRRVCDIAAEALKRIGTPEALAAVEEWQRLDMSATGRPGDK